MKNVHVVTFANQRRVFKDPGQKMMDYITFSLIRMSWFPVVITLHSVTQEEYDQAE